MNSDSDLSDLLLRTYAHYKGLPHQQASINLLWQNTPPLIKEKFIATWRNENFSLLEKKDKKAHSMPTPVPITSTTHNPPTTSSSPLDSPVIQVIGLDRPVRLSDTILSNGNFTWAEATKNGSRMPRSEMITRNIIELAQGLERIRSALGNQPMKITSWYRPPEVNRSVGGSSRSNHLTGAAADFVLMGGGMSIDQQFKMIQRLPWKGELLGYRKGLFIHVAVAPGTQQLWNK